MTMIMEPVKYDGIVHPEVWLNKIKVYCYQNNITKDEDIVEFCKSMIHPSIKISGTNLNEIVNSLKEDISFISFKDSIKRSFDASEYDFRHEEHEILVAL